jgi:hypothetical protein
MSKLVIGIAVGALSSVLVAFLLLKSGRSSDAGPAGATKAARMATIHPAEPPLTVSGPTARQRGDSVDLLRDGKVVQTFKAVSTEGDESASYKVESGTDYTPLPIVEYRGWEWGGWYVGRGPNAALAQNKPVVAPDYRHFVEGSGEFMTGMNEPDPGALIWSCPEGHCAVAFDVAASVEVPAGERTGFKSARWHDASRVTVELFVGPLETEPVRTVIVECALFDLETGWSRWSCGRDAPPVPADDVRAPTADASKLLALSATATSEHEPWKEYTFTASNLVDDNPLTSWQPMSWDRGTIKLQFDAEHVVDVLEVANGFQRNDALGDLFRLNRRVASALVQLDGGASTVMHFAPDQRGYTRLNLGGRKARRISLQVLSTHPGAKWQDLAVSDVRVLGR